MVYKISMTGPWPSRERPPDLGDAEAHVWVAAVDAVLDNRPGFVSVLSNEERERAGKFLREVDSRRYSAVRALLRHLLGDYIGRDPGKVRFAYNAYGKPELADSSERIVNFSVSHSGDLGLFGFVRRCRIGVDIEHIRPDINMQQLAKRWFSKNEFEKLETLPPDQQLDAFFRCWTRKEAYLKGRGEGITHGLDRFEVTLGPSEPVTILHADDDADVSRRWTLEHLTPQPGYLGAAAVDDGGIAFRCFRWEAA